MLCLECLRAVVVHACLQSCIESEGETERRGQDLHCTKGSNSGHAFPRFEHIPSHMEPLHGYDPCLYLFLSARVCQLVTAQRHRGQEDLPWSGCDATQHEEKHLIESAPLDSSTNMAAELWLRCCEERGGRSIVDHACPRLA